MRPTALVLSILLAASAGCAAQQRADVLGERGPIAVVGTLRCLPVRPNAPATGCVLGLEDDSARYYRLQESLLLADRPLTATDQNARVAIAGTFTPGGDDRFSVIGTIAIASLARI